jgi:hypothetical protein
MVQAPRSGDLSPTNGGARSFMGKVVNLTKERKARERAAAKAEAAANRLAHGRTKVERTSEEAAADRTARDLDAHKRERPDLAPDSARDSGPDS